MFKKINVSLIFLTTLIIRNIVKDASIGDAIIVCAAAALCGYNNYLDTKRAIGVNDIIKKDIEDLKSSVNTLKVARVMTR